MVSLNTAGGVTGGDKFSLSAQAGPGTTLTITTQACERAYKAQRGEVGEVRNRLAIAPGARLNWLPQETILFNECALNRCLSVEMTPDSTLLMVEPLVFGRAAMGESLRDAHVRDRIDIGRDGTPLYLDTMALDGDIAAHLARPFVANGAGAMASVIYIAADAMAHLTAVRAELPETAGASLIGDDVLVLRLLARDSFDLRTTLLPVLKRLNLGTIPRCWMI